MESFKHRGKEVKFWSITGEVIGQNKYSETHVSSSGGGGYVGKHGGFVNAPQVNSTVVTNHEFWIKKDNGVEESVQLSGADIPLREGQKVTAIFSHLSSEDEGPCSILVNHSERKHRFIKSASALNKNMGLDVFGGLSILTVAVIFFVVKYLADFFNNEDSITWAVCVSIFYLFMHLIIKHSRITEMEQKLSDHLESLAQKSYKKAASENI